MADVSIIILSHNKPDFVKEAVQSVLDQTHQNWEAVLMDSGVLLKQGFFDYIKDQRIKVIPSGETPDMAKRMNIASWCFNKLLASGQLQGELIMYLCDDDLLYKEAFETFWDFYLKNKRQPQAMYASQDIGLVDSQGKTQIIGKRVADRPAGRFCKGRRLDCEVDYLQFCHTRAILDKMREAYHTMQYHSEDRHRRAYADGVFMERIGALTQVYNIDKLVSMNRRTAVSANLDYAESLTGRFFGMWKTKLRNIRRLFDRGYLF